MGNKFKSGVKWLGGTFVSVFIEYILSQLGVIDIIRTYFTNNNHKVITFLNQPIPLWNVIIFVILTILSYLFILKVVFKNRKSKEDIIYELKDEFKKSHRFMRIPDNDTVEFKMDIYFTGDEITINKIEPYCLKHTERVKMYHDPKDPLFNCPKFPCRNIFLDLPDNRENVKHQILSDLENDWEILNK